MGRGSYIPHSRPGSCPLDERSRLKRKPRVTVLGYKTHGVSHSFLTPLLTSSSTLQNTSWLTHTTATSSSTAVVPATAAPPSRAATTPLPPSRATSSRVASEYSYRAIGVASTQQCCVLALSSSFSLDVSRPAPRPRPRPRSTQRLQLRQCLSQARGRQAADQPSYRPSGPAAPQHSMAKKRPCSGNAKCAGAPHVFFCGGRRRWVRRRGWPDGWSDGLSVGYWSASQTAAPMTYSWRLLSLSCQVPTSASTARRQWTSDRERAREREHSFLDAASHSFYTGSLTLLQLPPAPSPAGHCPAASPPEGGYGLLWRVLRRLCRR